LPRAGAAGRAIIFAAVSDADAPKVLRLAESSTPMTPPQRILTLSSDDISHFFVRLRRDPDSERWEVRLDAALREILERANDFVPSESGGILLDDPRAKLAGSPAPRLTFIAAFGTGSAEHLGQRLPSDRGICGEVYRSGRPLLTESIADDDPLVSSGVVTAPRRPRHLRRGLPFGSTVADRVDR